MTLTLTPEAESLLQQELSSGRFRDPSALITSALLALQDRRPDEAEVTAQRDLIGSKLEASFAAAERGESLSSEEFLAGLDQWKASLS